MLLCSRKFLLPALCVLALARTAVGAALQDRLLLQVGGTAAPDPAIKLEKNAEWVDTPGFGNGIEFHGKGSHARLAAVPADKLGDSVTISLFFKVGEFPEPRPNGDQWAGALFSSGYKWLGRVYSRRTVYGGLCNQKGELKGIFSQQQLTKDRWYHFALVYSAVDGQFTTYVDGERAGVRSDNITPLGKIKPERFLLGGDPDGCWFTGTVADFRIYDQVLSPAEVRQLAKRTQVPFTAKPNFPEVYGFVTDTFSGQPILPDSRIDEALLRKKITFTATPGEYEPATFVLRPVKDLGQTTFVLSDLKSADGKVMDRSALDLKIVKCWYQGPAAWRNEAPGKNPAIMVPELLLKDDDLVRVDEEKAINYLRYGRGADGRYVNVSSREDNNNFYNPMLRADHPIYDAGTLQPVNLKAGRNQQFHLTLQVPGDAAAGHYTGTVTAQSNGETVAEFQLAAEILPFKLPEPRTYYDLNKRYYTSIYYNASLVDDARAGITSYYRNADQVRAELKNLIAHGVMYPTNFQLNARIDDPAEHERMFREMLKLRKEAGLPNRPLHLISNPKINMKNLTASDEDLAKLTARTGFYLDIVEAELGHRDVYFYGFDEAKGEKLRGEIPFFKAIQKAGAKTFNSGYMAKTIPPGNFAMVGDVLDLLICCDTADPAEAARWHSRNREIWSYAYPQSSNENPLPYRRNFGYVIYKCNYDGVATFCYYLGFGHPWNDFDSTIQRDMNFVYPTADGVVDTVAFEGVREGFDDVRYATLMFEEAREARRSGDAAGIAAADAAAEYFKKQNVYLESPAKVRRGVIEHILKLRKLAGK